MCVILCFEDSYPKKAMLEQAETMNKDGGGMAWIEDGKVCWIKGMDVDSKKMLAMIKERQIKLPIIIHYRIATHGSVGDKLCHPFELNAKHGEDIKKVGVTTDGVLFHNGVWHDYDEVALNTLVARNNAKLPKGEWSDSRIMAWLVGHLGMDYLRLIDQKVTVLTPQGIKRFGKNWTEVDKITCSNSNFKSVNTNSFKGKVNKSNNMDDWTAWDDLTDNQWNQVWTRSRSFFRGDEI